MSKDMPLTLKSDTFNALTSDFDTMLRQTIETMERKEGETAEMTVKLKITLTKDEAPDLGVTAYAATREVVKPKFEHTINSVMTYKDKKSGTLSGDYELVWDRNLCKYVLRPIDNGQTSMFDKDAPGGDGVIEGSFTELSAGASGGVVALPAGEGGTGDQESTETVSADVKRFKNLLHMVGARLSCMEAMGIITIRCVDEGTVIATTAEGAADTLIQLPFETLKPHVGHNIVCCSYGEPDMEQDSVSIECQDCHEVIFDMSAPAKDEVVADEKTDGDDLAGGAGGDGYPYEARSEEGKAG